MEAKREVASVDIAAVTRELAAVREAHLDKAYLYPDRDLCRLRLRHHDEGRVELLAEVGEWKRFHRGAVDRLPAAPDRPPNFARMLRNRLAGGRLDDIAQLGFDRIVELTFDVPDGEVRVIVELFGDGNLVAVGTDGDVVDCLREVRLRSRTVRPGVPYEPPAARLDPFSLDEAELREAMATSDTDVVRTLATTVNLGGRYAEEVCARADVDQALAIADATAAEYRALAETLGDLGDRLERAAFDPHVYRDEHGVVEVGPFPLVSVGDLEAERYGTMSAALDAYFDALADRGASPDAADDSDAERARLERMAEQQADAVESFEAEAEALREQAELLYARYDVVDDLLGSIRGAREAGTPWAEVVATLEEGADRGIAAAELVEAVDPSNAEVTINLDGHRITLAAGEDLEHNADRLYREAKEAEEKAEGARAALEDTRRELEAEREARAEPSSTATGPRDWPSMSSVPVRRPEHWYERFRWFHTSDGFLVIGGRDAKQNEELVDKYAEPPDRVLHAQAHGGPVTVIKATAPDEPARSVDFPEATLEQAAQFAVSYSSVWKDGRFTGDAYMVRPEQMTKTAESGEYLATGAFAVRGEREYFEDVPVGVAVGIACEPETRVLGGPPAAVEGATEVAARLEPGRFAAGDVASRLYRRFRDRFADGTFVRKVARPDRIEPFLPPGGSRIVDG